MGGFLDPSFVDPSGSSFQTRKRHSVIPGEGGEKDELVWC